MSRCSISPARHSIHARPSNNRDLLPIRAPGRPEAIPAEKHCSQGNLVYSEYEIVCPCSHSETLQPENARFIRQFTHASHERYGVHCTILYTGLYVARATTTLILHHKRKKLFYRFLLQQNLEAEWLERHTITNEMLAHRLDPMQTQGMQHGTRTLHDTQHSDCACKPEVEDGNDENSTFDTSEAKCVLHCHVP
jgi:hypothetical protein